MYMIKTIFAKQSNTNQIPREYMYMYMYLYMYMHL